MADHGKDRLIKVGSHMTTGIPSTLMPLTFFIWEFFTNI